MFNIFKLIKQFWKDVEFFLCSKHFVYFLCRIEDKRDYIKRLPLLILKTNHYYIMKFFKWYDKKTIEVRANVINSIHNRFCDNSTYIMLNNLLNLIRFELKKWEDTFNYIHKVFSCLIFVYFIGCVIFFLSIAYQIIHCDLMQSGLLGTATFIFYTLVVVLIVFIFRKKITRFKFIKNTKTLCKYIKYVFNKWF